MQINDMTLLIGGDAGQGIESSGAGFCKALARTGLHVFSVPNHRSRIRGGHNYITIRTSENPITSWTEPIHLLIALTPETVTLHKDKLVPGSALLFDQELGINQTELEEAGFVPVAVPLEEIAVETGGNKVMANTAAMGAVAGLTQLPFPSIESVIKDNFRKKGDKVIQANLSVARAAFDYVAENFNAKYSWKLKPTKNPQLMVMHGNQALSLGALVAGCNFVAAYPMTPASSIFQWFISHGDKYNVVVKQAEDEIAAACMGVGASFVGARVLIPTSGGGFALMTEALGFAGMIETPVVFVNAQRPGPATGLATRTEQSDLLFIIHASQSEFPRLVFAPGTVEQCFEIAGRAFNLAEKYQTPVIILTDALLASSLRSFRKDDLDFSKIKQERGKLLSDTELDKLTDSFRRYELTTDGISPRAVPGHPKAIIHSSSNEHDEFGYLTEDKINRKKMHEKRMRKLDLALSEMQAPIQYGPEEADLTFVCWGSTLSPVLAAMEILNQEKPGQANVLQFIDIWPFPIDKVLPFLQNANILISVEQNYTGQLANLLDMETCIGITRKILRYDGRPISPEYILEKLKEVV